MKRWFAVALVMLLVAPWTVADNDERQGSKSDFALFDGTDAENASSGAVCGARELRKDRAFTYHVAVTNHGPAGFVRITYFDTDWVQYQIAAGGSFSLSQAAGGRGGADRAVRVSNGGSGAVLAGAMSVIGGEDRPFCISCDADSAADAGCDAIIPD